MQVLDTNILIYFLQDEPHVTRQILQWARLEMEKFAISAITYAEILSLASLRQTEIARIEILLNDILTIPVDINHARLAAAFRRGYHLKLADALIAATAFSQNSPLVTRNVKDFARVSEITIEKL